MERRRSKRVATADIVRRGSIARAMTGGGTAVGTDGAIVMTEMVTSTGEGQDPETVSKTASDRTGIARARTQGTRGDIGRGVKNADVTGTATEGREITIAITKERRVPDVRKGVDPIAVGADRGHHTSTQGHAERGYTQNPALYQHPHQT